VRVKVRLLQSQLERALKLLPRPLPADIEAVEVVLLDRAAMTQVHGDFLADATVTDVITFPYGEILVCPSVAQDAALVNGLSVHDEILLYALHGVLHLTGYDDKEPSAAQEMAQAQDELLRATLAG
jgi:probable rRNA maturation factor